MWRGMGISSFRLDSSRPPSYLAHRGTQALLNPAKHLVPCRAEGTARWHRLPFRAVTLVCRPLANARRPTCRMPWIASTSRAHRMASSDRPLERALCGGGDGAAARSKRPRGHTRHQIVVRHRRCSVAHRALTAVVYLCGRGHPHPCHQAETGSGVVVVVHAPWRLYNTPSPFAFGRG